MSYSIGSRVVGLEHEYIDLFPGNSSSTISAVAASGFDAQEIFSEYIIHNWDSLGLYPDWAAEQTDEEEGRPLDTEIVLEAYHHAIAWMLALRKNFPDHVEKINPRMEHPEVHLQRKEIDRQRVKTLMEQKLNCQKNLTEDQIERSIRHIHFPISYCSKVLPQVQQGKEIYIFYS